MNEEQEFRRQYYKEQRRIHSGQRNLPCPDCGRPNKLTAGEVAKGYHCSQCTRDLEGYQPPSEHDGYTEY